MRKILLFCFAVLTLAADAQKELKGHIFSNDKTPVVAATVYLSNTSKGATSDENGYFVLKNVPGGKYELIVSCVGYEIARKSIDPDQLPADLVIYLEPKTEELREVVVNGDVYDKEGWVHYGHLFLENFIGTTDATACAVENKDVLRFRYSPGTNIVTITAKEDLVIRNNELGYLLRYALVKFEYNFVTRQFSYRGYPFFTEMQSANERQQKKWESNRQEIYKGSLLHFMRSVYHNKIEEERFEVRALVKVDAAERKRVRDMFARQSKKKPFNSGYIKTEGGLLSVADNDTSYTISADTLAYFNSVMKQISQEEIKIDILLDARHIAAAKSRTSKHLIFAHGIEVVYLPKARYPRYQNTLSVPEKYRSVYSVLFNAPGNLVFLSDGSFSGDNLVDVKGYWSWSEKMCRKLPYEFGL